MDRPILPGSVIGVLGGGQLGRMFAIAARKMGYRVYTLAPEDDTPNRQVSDKRFPAQYDDLDKVRHFANVVDVVTFEFENIPVTTIAEIEKLKPVRPSGAILHLTQHRLREKMFLKGAGFPVTSFRRID